MNVQFTFIEAKDCLQLFTIYEEIAPILSIQTFDDHVLIECMDDSHTMISKCTVKKSYFAYYQSLQTGVIHVPMKIMDKVLKCIDKEDQVTMDATDEHLVITLCKNKKQTKMKISLVDVDIESFQVPANIEFDTISMLQSGFFSQQINKMKQLGEHTIEFKTNEEYLFLKSTGDLVETEISVQAGKPSTPESIKNGVRSPELIFIKSGNCSHEYSLGSIKQFMKPASWIPEMEISIKKDFPILFKYDTENVSLLYYLAPKIED